MISLHQIKSAIDNLNLEEFPRQKQELLAMFEHFTPTNGNGNGHGNGHGNGNGHHQKLSPREREVMDMILSGRRLKEIAAMLDISVKTVTTHRSRLLRKLGVEDNLGLYRYGIRSGLIGL